MSMQSQDLLTELQALPEDEDAPDSTSTFADNIRRIREMDRDMFVVEVALGTEEVLERLFDATAADDVLIEAHSLSFADYDDSLHQHYQDMLQNGSESVAGFLSNLKSKVAELKAESILGGYFPGYDFEISSDPTQGVLELHGVGAGGAQSILTQVRTGGRGYTPDAVEGLQSASDGIFVIGRQVYDGVVEAVPDLAMQTAVLGASNLILTADIAQELGVLGANVGFSAPESIGGMLPYAGEIVMGVKLIYDMVSTERDFKDVDLADRSRVHALKTLVLMSKFGVTTVCVTAGSMAGGAGGTFALPGIGTAAGGIIGGASGAAFAALLNHKLRSRMMDMAMHLSKVDDEEFFYLRNKSAADEIGNSLASTNAL